MRGSPELWYSPGGGTALKAGTRLFVLSASVRSGSHQHFCRLAPAPEETQRWDQPVTAGGWLRTDGGVSPG